MTILDRCNPYYDLISSLALGPSYVRSYVASPTLLVVMQIQPGPFWWFIWAEPNNCGHFHKPFYNTALFFWAAISVLVLGRSLFQTF
jgi:hypothetical protein